MLGNQETCKPIGLGNWLMWYTPLEFMQNQTHHVIIQSQINATKIEDWIDIF
jgi:hypothetical protein